MKKLIEIRWHGRGGQGAVTASKLLATAALNEGFYIQAFPEYGAERMGAPIRAFNRICSETIDLHCQINEPDIVIVLDHTLLKTIDITAGIKNGGIIIINTPDDIENTKKTLNLKKGDKSSICVVDATKISIETLGKVIPNTPMMGALVKVTDFIKLSTLLTAIEKTLSKKIPVSMIEANILAVKRAYKEVIGNASGEKKDQR